MQCHQCQDFDPRWDEFVLANASGTFFHLLKWREILAQSFGYHPFYFYVEERGEIAGVLPLFLVKSLLFGKGLVTIPLGVYGGIVAQTDEAKELLFERARALCHELRVRYLEIRGNPYGNSMNGSVDDSHRLESRDLYVSFIQDIDSKAENNFSRIPRKQRRMIRQAQKFGLRSVLDDSRLKEFYRIYAHSVRNLGTPVFSYEYFKNLKEAFGDNCKILLVIHQEKPVAGVLTFLHKDQILPYYGGALRDYFQLAPNDFMYWELMSFGAANGYKIFDFGRSKIDSGSFDFKRHWGFEPRPLPYLYYRVHGKALPDTSARNPRLQWAIRLWRGLPLRLTMVLGPHIVRHTIP